MHPYDRFSRFLGRRGGAGDAGPSASLPDVRIVLYWLEWQDWANPILAEPFTLDKGHLIPRDVPGNGLEWDEDAVQRHRLEL